MTDSIPYADIVILALVAGFILLRLRSVLGSKPDGDRPDFFRKDARADIIEPIVQLENKLLKPVKPREEADPLLASVNDQTHEQVLASIRAADPHFIFTQFVEGATRAYEMVFDAFSKGDKPTLKMLLSDELYQNFAKAIDERKDQDEIIDTTLVSVEYKGIEQVDLKRSIARIGLKLSSEQVQLTRNTKGDIIRGDASELHRIEDSWVFERDLNSKAPNWKIIET